MFINKISTCFSVLEVYQFARDASVAEQWLMAQEPYLTSTELGVSSIDELMNWLMMVSAQVFFVYDINVFF